MNKPPEGVERSWSLAGKAICTLSPQPRGDSSTPGPYSPVVTSLAPKVRDGLVRTVVVIEDEKPIAQAVAARPGRVSTREELLAQVWGYDVPSGARTVDSHIRTIRRKLGSSIVRTVHGVGYAIEEAHACT